MFLIFFVYGTFIMPQKKSFGQKKFEFHARVQSANFGRMEKFDMMNVFVRSWYNFFCFWNNVKNLGRLFCQFNKASFLTILEICGRIF